jgi:hypothetical protein
MFQMIPHKDRAEFDGYPFWTSALSPSTRNLFQSEKIARKAIFLLSYSFIKDTLRGLKEAQAGDISPYCFGPNDRDLKRTIRKRAYILVISGLA